MSRDNIIRATPSYLVIDKPADMKIDLPLVKSAYNNEITTTPTPPEQTVQSNLQTLFPPSSPLESSTPPSQRFRWCHQLDSATSGLMLIGLSKEFTRRASKAFEERRVKKKYLAVMPVGVVSSSSMANNIVTITKEDFDRVWGSVTTGYAVEANKSKNKNKNKNNNNSSNQKGPGYRPASSFFEQWKMRRLSKRSDITCTDSDTEADAIAALRWKDINININTITNTKNGKKRKNRVVDVHLLWKKKFEDEAAEFNNNRTSSSSSMDEPPPPPPPPPPRSYRSCFACQTRLKTRKKWIVNHSTSTPQYHQSQENSKWFSALRTCP